MARLFGPAVILLCVVSVAKAQDGSLQNAIKVRCRLIIFYENKYFRIVHLVN